MRLKKLSLVAAASLATSSLFAATATLTTGGVSTDVSLYQDITVARGSLLTIDAQDSFTFQNKILGVTQPSPEESSVNIVLPNGSGNVVKTGAGTLQVDSYAGLNTYSGNTFLGRLGAADILRVMSDANQGTLRVKQGQVVVSGYISQFVDIGIRAHTPTYDALYPTLTDGFAGFRSTILEGSALLDFQNTARNVATQEPVFDGQPDRVTPPLQMRLNFVSNLKAGDNNDQNQTRLNTGDADTRLVVNMSAGEVGGVGYLTGAGRVFKTGAGEFRLLNEGTFNGDVVIAGGALTLASAGGNALAKSYSVNMASVINPGSAYWGVDSAGGTSEWQPQYVPYVLSGATLNIVGTQHINNFQIFFNAVGGGAATLGDIQFTRGSTDYSEPYVIGRGEGSNLNVAAGSKLIIQQDFNGFYQGNITALSDVNDPNSHTVGGDIVKRGAGTLVLFTTAARFQNLTIEAGSMITNVQSLGSNTVTLASGAGLSFVQNDVGALDAVIRGDLGGTLSFAKSGTVKNYAGQDITIGNGQIGTVHVSRAQAGFFGTVVVQDGMELILSSAGGDTFPNAAIRLITGTNGEETRLSFADTNQTVRALAGDLNTKVDLGRGTITLTQSTDSTYSGKITGTGGLIKDGAGTFVMDGRDALGNGTTTYSGATTVRGGKLVLAGPNQIQSTSGLILLNGGAVAVTGSQTFGALFGTAGTVLDMGSGNLTIGLTPAQLALLAEQEANSAPNPGRYLGTGSTESVSIGGRVYGADGDAGIAYLAGTNKPVAAGTPGSTPSGTRAYLASVGLTDAKVLADLAFAGKLSGSGKLIKIGSEQLYLSGVNDGFTGATEVRAGTLKINVDALPSTSGITVAAGAVLAVNVDSGSAVFASKVAGEGLFTKTGAGTLVLNEVSGLSGGYRVASGTLQLATQGGFDGDVKIETGAVLGYAPGTDATLTGVLTGTGTFFKDGVARVTLADPAGITAFTGRVQLGGGTLLSTGLSPADIALAAGATYGATLSGATVYTRDLSGEGTLAITGGQLQFVAGEAGSALFTGTLSGRDTTFVAATNNILSDGAGSAARLALANSGLSIGATQQTLASLAGDASSSVTLSGGALTLAPASGRTVFDGTLSGNGTLVKTGAGTAALTSFTDTHWTGATIINAGVLEATPMALGDSAVTVNAGGTLALRNPDAETPLSYANAISGAGVIGKTGAGVVNLDNASAGFTGTLYIAEGELRASQGTLGGQIFPRASVAKAGTYAVVLASDLVHDSAAANAFKVSGEGSLAVEGAHTLKLVNGQSYAGNTILRSGATLDLTDATFSGTLNGLAGEAGTSVKSGPALTIAQNVAGIFAGTFANPTDLTVTGTAKLAFISLANVGSTTIDGGRLAVDASLTKDITLVNGGTLYFDTTSGAQVYQGFVSGAGDLFKTGAGELRLTDTTAFTNQGAIGVDQGRLVVTTTGLGANLTSLKTAGTGTLALDVADGGVDSTTFTRADSLAITGPGALSKTGSGKLILGTAANPYTVRTTGAFTVAEGTLGGTFATTGDLVVASGGTLAPGNSPGVVSVGGNFTSTGTLALELNATTSDLIQVAGDATLDPGTIFRFTQDSTPGAGAPVRGAKYTVLTAASIQTVEGDFVLDGTVDGAGNFTPAVGTSRVLIVTPQRNGDAAGALFGKGAANAVVVYYVGALGATPGYAPHEGLSGFLSTLDGLSVDETGKPVGPINAVGAAVALTPTADLSRVVNALSPLGFGSLYAMERDTALRQEDRIRERMEQRRYDQGGYSPYEWEAFVVGGAAMADNQAKTDTPIFDTRTYGGLVGLDTRLESGTVVGGAAGYDNGTANLHDGAGKVEMNRVRGTGFLSTKLSTRWFLDAGLSAGFGDFDTKRNTVAGRATGSTTGVDVGGNVFTGTIVTLNEALHLTPFAGLSFAHHEFSGFTEKGGNGAALKVDSWSNDSLRFSVGSGLGWWVPAGDWKWKLGVDAAFNHELLDTESDLDARFVTGGSRFGTTAAALPSDSVSLAPNAALHFDENNAISGGVNFEYGFDGRTYTGFNVAFRRRF